MKNSGLRLISSGHNFTRQHWRVSHAHPMHEMVIVTFGCERVVVGGERFEAKAGTVLYFPPGLLHAEISFGARPAENLVMQFECDWDTRSWPRHCQDARGRLRMLVAWLFESRDARRPEESAANQALFKAVLHEYRRLILDQEDERVRIVRHYIENHMARPLTVDELALQIGMSKYHFIRLYKELAGVTPMADVRMIRVARARDLILADRLPLKEIAQATGLGNAMTLSRLCRRQYQMAPAQFRKSAPAPQEHSD